MKKIFKLLLILLVATVLLMAALLLLSSKGENATATSKEQISTTTSAPRIFSNAEDPLLGAPYRIHSLQNGNFYATLIEYPFGSSPRVDAQDEFPRGIILYLHGYNDYFFQKELAEKADSAGFAFFAIDLHYFGRSYREGDPRADMRSLTEYFGELDSAITLSKRIVQQSIDKAASSAADSASENSPSANSENAIPATMPYILIGHSMGGLNLSLYAAHRPDSHFDAIVLNSPFLEMNFNWAVRNLALPVVSGLGRLFPNVALPGTGDPNYANSLYKSRKGEWDFDTTLKTFARPKQYLGWVRGVHLGHNEIKEGLHIKAPILVMHSDCSIDSKEWVEEFNHCDGVLNHEQIAEQAPNLGENVTTVTIPDGLHDLYLSPKPVRDKAYDETFRFIDKNLRK